MKISKATSETIKSSTDVMGETEETKEVNYQEAIDYVMKAIDSLGKYAAYDQKSKEILADLAVVYAELKNEW